MRAMAGVVSFALVLLVGEFWSFALLYKFISIS